MKRLARKIEKLMTAAAFAEAGEHETAREIEREEESIDDRENTDKDAARPMRRPRTGREIEAF